LCFTHDTEKLHLPLGAVVGTVHRIVPWPLLPSLIGAKVLERWPAATFSVQREPAGARTWTVSPSSVAATDSATREWPAADATELVDIPTALSAAIDTNAHKAPRRQLLELLLIAAIDVQ
jgi:hypothetical protein